LGRGCLGAHEDGQIQEAGDDAQGIEDRGRGVLEDFTEGALAVEQPHHAG
jgi:hypothetical protein